MHALHHLPTNNFAEGMSIVLLLVTTYHAFRNSHRSQLLTCFVASCSYHLYFRQLPPSSTWAAPSLLSSSQYLPRPHDVGLLAVSLYYSTTTTTKPLLCGLSSLFFLLPHEMHSVVFLGRTWHAHYAQTSLWGLPVVVVLRLFLFSTLFQWIGLCYLRPFFWRLYTMKHLERFPSIDSRAIGPMLVTTAVCLSLAFTSMVGKLFEAVILDWLMEGVNSVLLHRVGLALLVVGVLWIQATIFWPNQNKGNSPFTRHLQHIDTIYYGVLCIYFVGIVFISWYGDPSTHRSFGFHQQWGGTCGNNGEVCREQESQSSWQLCSETFQEYPIGGIDPVHNTVSWYGICGRERNAQGTTDKLLVAGVLSGLQLTWLVERWLMLKAKGNNKKQFVSMKKRK